MLYDVLLAPNRGLIPKSTPSLSPSPPFQVMRLIEDIHQKYCTEEAPNDYNRQNILNP